MKLWEKFVAFCKGEKPEDFDPAKITYDGKPMDLPPAPEPAKATADDGATAAFKAELEPMKAQLAAMQEKSLAEKAAAFASEMITSHKAIPAMRNQIIASFTEAARADASGKALFSADGNLVEGSSLKALKELFAAQPAHVFADTLTANAAGLTTLPVGQGEAVPAERRDQLLAKTAMGRQILSEEKAKGGKA